MLHVICSQCLQFATGIACGHLEALPCPRFPDYEMSTCSSPLYCIF